MTLNWGNKLAILFVAFATLMGVLVYKSINTKYHLVSKDYYKDELAYQQIIDASKNATKDSIVASASISNNQLTVIFNNNTIKDNIKGSAWVYNATSDAFDTKQLFEISNKNALVLPLKNTMPKGKNIVKLFFAINQINYYLETTINI
jgi:FixH